MSDPRDPTVVSLFAGCGGSSLGYRWAGYRELLAVEWDANAAATFRLNFPDVPLFEGDVAVLSDEEALRLAGVSPGELDVLDGSPPCQGFSTAGRRRMTDDRNQLFREYVRLLRAFRPRALVMENVPGMVRGKMRVLAAEAFCLLEGAGYRVSGRILNAADFGVPQARKRLIVVGVRADLGIPPDHPDPRGEHVTVREALASGVNGEVPAPPLRGKAGWIAKNMRPGQHGDDVTGKSWFNNVRLRWDAPSVTITKMGSYMGVPLIVHPDEHRGLSVGEMKRLHSFPDDFKMTGSWDERVARIGNSVPPSLMRAVAEHVRDELLARAP